MSGDKTFNERLQLLDKLSDSGELDAIAVATLQSIAIVEKSNMSFDNALKMALSANKK